MNIWLCSALEITNNVFLFAKKGLGLYEGFFSGIVGSRGLIDLATAYAKHFFIDLAIEHVNVALGL